MRINSKNIPNNIKTVHSLNYKKIIGKAMDVDLKKESVKNFIENTANKMVKTCINDGGVGLAAPQIGIPKKIIVIKEFINQNIWDDYTDYFNVYINPTIIQNIDSPVWEFNEACLSVPGVSLPIKRISEIFISYYTYDHINNEFKLMEEKIEGYLARVLLHEHDHLLGISIVDRFNKQQKK